MKTKNNLTTGILIGISVIVLPLILMGTTYITEKKNTYEYHSSNTSSKVGGIMINTETGESWYILGSWKEKHKIKE